MLPGVFGLAAVVLAPRVAVLTGGDKRVEARVVDLLPDAWMGATTLL